MTARLSLCLGLALFVLVALGLVHLAIGARPIAPPLLWQALTRFDPANFDHQVLINLRLPRLGAALLCGGCLGLAGALLQALLRNPLAEPHLLGLNAGASLMVVITSALPVTLLPAMLAGLARPLLAAIGAGGLFALVLALSSAGRSGLTMTKLVFCGIALSALAGAVVSGILILDQDTLETLRLWLTGDLAGAARADLRSTLPLAALGLMAALIIAPRLDALTLGDAAAIGLGVPLRATRRIGLIAAALLCGVAVAVAGPIGFIGLIVPRLAYPLAGRRHRSALLFSALFGSALLLAADSAARVLLAPHELATGIMTALIGAPVFLILIVRGLK